LEEARIFPAHQVFRRLGDAGLLGITKPEAFGGLEQLREISKKLSVEAPHIELPFTSKRIVGLKMMDALVRRQSLSCVEDRAAALFDLVNFLLYSPLEQVTQLCSLAYFVYSAHSKLLQRMIDINFARSTTGDGFYIWNCSPSIQANVNLYHFMHLVLADNAIARSKAARRNAVPLSHTCFDFGILPIRRPLPDGLYLYRRRGHHSARRYDRRGNFGINYGQLLSGLHARRGCR
jgi:hypothetical protein